MADIGGIGGPSGGFANLGGFMTNRFGTFGDVVKMSVTLHFRITSYNVCYTKLLRLNTWTPFPDSPVLNPYCAMSGKYEWRII